MGYLDNIIQAKNNRQPIVLPFSKSIPPDFDINTLKGIVPDIALPKIQEAYTNQKDIELPFNVSHISPEEQLRKNIIAEQQKALGRTAQIEQPIQKDFISTTTNKLLFENQFQTKKKDILKESDISLKSPDDIIGSFLTNISKKGYNVPIDTGTQIRAARTDEIYPKVQFQKEPILSKIPNNAVNAMKSYTSGVAKTVSNIYKIPALFQSISLIPANIVAEATGFEELKTPEFLYNNSLTKTLDRYSESMSYKQERWQGENFETILKRKNIPEITEYVLHSVIENAPTQFALLAAAGAGYATQGLAFMGAISGADKFSEGTKKDISQNMNTVNAILNGSIEVLGESLGTLGAFKSMSTALTKSVGVSNTRKILADVGKSIAYSFMAEANEEALTTFGQAFSDKITGFDKDAFKGIGYKMLESGLVGGISGATMTAPFSISTGYNKAKVNKEIRNLENALKSIETIEGGTDYATGSKEGVLDISGQEELPAGIEQEQAVKSAEPTKELKEIRIIEGKEVPVYEQKQVKPAETIPEQDEMPQIEEKIEPQKIEREPLENIIKTFQEEIGYKVEPFSSSKSYKSGAILKNNKIAEIGEDDHSILRELPEKLTYRFTNDNDLYFRIPETYNQGQVDTAIKLSPKNFNYVAIDILDKDNNVINSFNKEFVNGHKGQLRMFLEQTKPDLQKEVQSTPTEKPVIQPAISKIEEKSLIEEARKYKSAEEFVKSKKNIYHGTDKVFKEFDVKKTPDGSIWFTDNKDSILKGDSGASGTSRIIDRFVDENKLKLAGWEEYDKYSLQQIQEMGFDGIKLADDGKIDYQIFYPEKLSTKKQLTDIWKKANKNIEIEPLIQEAKKYKSAEDFPKLQEVVDGAIAKAGERTFEAQKAFNEIIKRTDLSVKELEALSNKVDDLIFHKGYTAEQALQTINQANKVGGGDLISEAKKYDNVDEFVKAQKGYVGKDTLTGKPINMVEEIAKKPKYQKTGDADFDAYSMEYYKRYDKEIKPQLLENAKKSFDEPGKVKVIDVDMSGSYKRGTPNTESDLDVKVYYEGTKPVDEFRDQMETLSDNIYGIHDVHFQKVEAKSQLKAIWNKAHTTTPESGKPLKEAVLPEKERIIPETTEPAKEHYQMTKEISMNQQIQDIIRTSKNTLEAQKAIKVKFDLDLSLPEIKTMETAIKSGVPFDIAPQLMRDLLNKIKAKDTKIVDDLGLDKEFNISIERIMDSMTLLGKTKEFINENYKQIVQAINQLEFTANYCYAYSDTKPYQESIVDSFVKEIKMLTIVDNSIKSIKMAEHPEILRKIWLKADRTNVNVDKLIKENPELVETDLIANEGLKELRNLIQKQIITEYMDGLFGIRIKTEGIRHQVEYTLKTGEKRIKWVNSERYYKMTVQYPGEKLKLLDTKELIILKIRDPKTGEYSQKRMMVEKYDEVLKSALLTEHQQELANNLIPYKNWISHLRKGDYWVIVNEKTSAGQFVEVFASRVKNRFIAQKIKEEIENKSKAFIVDVHKHKETFMAEKLFLGSVVNIPAKLKNIGIDPLSDAGQRIINSQRSMSTIFSHLIESKNLPGFETSYDSIIEGISQIAQSAIHRQNRIEMQDLLGEAIKNKKTFTDPFRYKVLVQYLTAIAEAREASPVLDSIKSITYFSILGNSFRAAIQNLSEPIWYWARLPKLNNPIRFTLPLQQEYIQLIEQAKNEGIIKPYLEPDINASKIQKIEFLFNESEKFGTKICFNLALRLARDKGLHGQEAYRFAYQQVFNVAKPFYNRGNVPIGLLKSKFRGTTEFGLMFLRWVLDWFGKTARGVGAGFIRTLLKTGLAWVIIAGLGTVPIIGRRLVRILGLGGFEKKPQDLNIQERFILGGLMGTAKVDTAFLVPLMYKGAGTVNLGITRGFDILRERMSRTERDVKKYGTTGYFGSIPMIGQYISGAQKAKYGIKSGKKIIYTPATVYEKMLLRVGLTPLALGETYKIREEIKELSKKINKLRQEEKTKNFKEKMKLKKEIIILEKQKKQLAKNISSY